ncbi:MAG: 2-C-methyl-D-erythritol 4-phosphate cytidylyltransferase [Gammaproteobacteria bacterium]|nr:2-C-methyl-D-erythritol 4-phosphate cytidylyltransferase [Gammaproteobacteria bacterium]
MTEARFWAIVPAAGVGRRMGGEMPKQYLRIGDRCILEHTLATLAACSRVSGICVAIADGDPYWPTLAIPDRWRVTLAAGGAERANSVLNALEVLLMGPADPLDWVLVHDAARPCLRHEDLERLIDVACRHPVGGILAQPVADTVKRVSATGDILETVNRNGLWYAQTPQMFHLAMLRDALATGLGAGFGLTDEASAMERAGWTPIVVEGHAENIKITSPQDLELARTYLTQRVRA